MFGRPSRRAQLKRLAEEYSDRERELANELCRRKREHDKQKQHLIEALVALRAERARRIAAERKLSTEVAGTIRENLVDCIDYAYRRTLGQEPPRTGLETAQRQGWNACRAAVVEALTPQIERAKQNPGRACPVPDSDTLPGS